MLILGSVVSAQNIVTADPSQAYSTKNLVTFNQNGSTTTSPWQNVGQWGGQLSCWGPDNPGYCGPQPYVNANGYGMINFSYGYTDLYQTVKIASALPDSGTGLRVDGFNFGFTAKNGNGWDGGRQDYLAAYVSFYDINGKLTENYDYSSSTNQRYNWTTFNFAETFNTPYAAKDLSTARYGFVGYDTNFWAGPYGPEIYNVRFSLKYSVDPCATNPLYSATCPGFNDALAKLTVIPSSSPTNNDTSTTTTPTTTITTIITDDPINPTVTVTSTPITQSSVATVTATGEKTSTNSTSNTSLGLSVIAKNQQREQNTVNQTVQNAVATAASASVSSQQEALSIASTSVANSIAFSVVNNFSSSTAGLKLSSGAQMGFSIQSSELSMSNESYAMSYKNALTDRTNPLNEYMDHKAMTSSTSVFSGPSVNPAAGNNDIAGGVDLSKMALAPTGYNDYLNFTMKDIAFYQPKEVYKNQKNVDNMKALRQLSSDRLHQDMVEQQYRR